MLASVASRSLLISSNGLRKVATSSISSSRGAAGGGGLAAAAWRGLGQQGGGQRPRLLVTLTRSSRPKRSAPRPLLLPGAKAGGVGGPMRRVSSPLRPPQTRGTAVYHGLTKRFPNSTKQIAHTRHTRLLRPRLLGGRRGDCVRDHWGQRPGTFCLHIPRLPRHLDTTNFTHLFITA